MDSHPRQPEQSSQHDYLPECQRSGRQARDGRHRECWVDMGSEMIPTAAIDAARPWAEAFLRRRGYEPRGKEVEVLVRYIIRAAAPHIIASALREAADNLEYGNPINQWLYERADEIEGTP